MSVEELLSFIFDFLDEDMRITGAELNERSITVFLDDGTERIIKVE